jgi:hypothetical protein
LYSGLTQPPPHDPHSRKRKRRVCITGFLTQSNNKGRWSVTARRSPGGETLVGPGKATLMRECGAMQRFWVSRRRGAKIFEREIQRHAKVFEWGERFCKSLKNSNPWESITVFIKKSLLFMENRQQFFGKNRCWRGNQQQVLQNNRCWFSMKNKIKK